MFCKCINEKSHIKLLVSLIFLTLVSTVLAAPTSTVLVEAESFSKFGGWVLDTQVMDQMGSPYLLAHGLGKPVDDAITTVKFPQTGEYRIWVRTRDWVGQWKKDGLSPVMKAEGFPGKFQLIVDGKAVGTTFGTEGADWHWQDGGVVHIKKKDVVLSLHDLTGFDGRCDAIVFSTDHQLGLPGSIDAMSKLRRELLGHPESLREAGEYDIVVVGGGMAGICTAVSAARGGCSVALIQNRPVLGGNNSSEVRVGLSGLVRKAPYPKLGNLVDEIGPVGHWNKREADLAPDLPRSKYVHEVMKKHPEKKTHNAGPASNYEDQKKINVVLAEKNISLFLNMHVNGVTKDGSRITSVTGQNTRTGERLIFKGRLFADCTGDGNLGFMAKADFRVGREAKSLTEEKLAPAKSDELVMGTSVQWYSTIGKKASAFPECTWGVRFDEKSCTKTTRGEWDWETGANYDQVMNFEHIRDYGLRVVFGNWAVLKNHERFRKQFAKRKLEWVAYIGGKRESRRLLGDVILCQHDIVDKKKFPDACVTTTWSIDLHYPKKPLCACDAFRSKAKHLKITPYPIPYRCLYSRNVDNLMMAGRNISVTHVALGTVRVMRTTGMMGEVLGMAASVCKKQSCDPGDVYTNHWPEMQELMKKGVPYSSFDDTVGGHQQGRIDSNMLPPLKDMLPPLKDKTKTYRIMPVGDSITQGRKRPTNYRYRLLKKLNDSGYHVKYVGTKKSNSPLGRLSHEGYGGATAEDLASFIGNNFRKHPADIVLIHSGHNHFITEKPVPGIVAATETIIQDFRKTNPHVIVLLAQVITSGKLPKYSYIPDLNESLEPLANRLNRPSQPVLLVDHAADFNWKEDTVRDKVHPNAQGAEKMANCWFQALTGIKEMP